MTVDPQTMANSNMPAYAAELARDANNLELKTIPAFSSSDFVVQPVDLDYGKKSKNPIDFVRFYSKSEQDLARKVRELF